MAYRILFLLVILNLSYSQKESYFGKNSFVIEGTKIHDSLKESPYDRLPLSYKEYVRKPVWDLSKSSAGLSIRFISNSSSISACLLYTSDAADE